MLYQICVVFLLSIKLYDHSSTFQLSLFLLVLLYLSILEWCSDNLCCCFLQLYFE